jgi:hypothetical protein
MDADVKWIRCERAFMLEDVEGLKKKIRFLFT